MIKKISLGGFFLIAISILLWKLSPELSEKHLSIEEKRKIHLEYLKKVPFKSRLFEEELASKGAPPNKYFESEWELTLNPETGRPEPEKVIQLQKKIAQKKRRQRKTPGDSPENPWLERGPNNVSGRTRTLLFDPNDPTHKKVFAGSVSGGLWVNQDITKPNSPWTQVSGVPGNMNVSCIAVDPRNSSIWYLGTGEQYTGSASGVVGNGIYKTTDGGLNWTNVPITNPNPNNISITQGGVVSFLFSGIYFVNDIIAWDNGTSTDIFAGIGTHSYQRSENPRNFLGLQSTGLYKSSDGGSSWNRIESDNMRYVFNSSINFYYVPNDFEISENNTLWMGTTSPPFIQFGGGKVFNSTDGTTWTLKSELPNSNRVELALSSTNSNKIYALTEGTDNIPYIFKTTDAFATAPTALAKPNDVDPGIPANDFARKQSFYNLMIEVDPVNDNILYVGGIDLFRSINGGVSWSQISRRNADIPGNTSVVHADQHAMIFRPGNSNQAVFGNDGGVYYATTLSGAASSTQAIHAVNTNYNTTQFYRAAIGPRSEQEYFLGGTQDNGTPYFFEPSTTPASSTNIGLGDGGYCFVDQIGEDYIIVSGLYNTYALYYTRINSNRLRIINLDSTDEGNFINPADLDSNMDVLYANGSVGNSYRINRYSNLTAIPQGGRATKVTLRSSFLDSSPTAFKVSPYTTTSTTLLVGTKTGKLLKIVRTNTSSPRLTEITGLNFLGSISDIEFGTNEDEILVTFHNYGVSNIWFSSDGGENWLEKEGNLPDIPVKSILQNPLETNEVIVGTELGVWKTQNFGEVMPIWTQTYNGMSDVKITDLQYRAEGSAVLAATYGRGLFTGTFSRNLESLGKNEDLSESIVVYPTISEGRFTIASDRTYGNISLVVYNTEGVKVYSQQNITLLIGIDKEIVLNQGSGVYYLKILLDGKSLTKKIIISH